MAMKPPRQLSEQELWEYALKALGARSQSTSELKTKLRRRAQNPADIDTTVARLKEYGFLNDRQFAENYAARRLENEGFGQARVLSDLRARRVVGVVAESAVKTTFAETDEIQLIDKFLARKYRRQPLPTVLADPKGLQSVYRKLRLAGFSHTNTVNALKRHAKETEVLDTIEPEDFPQEE